MSNEFESMSKLRKINKNVQETKNWTHSLWTSEVPSWSAAALSACLLWWFLGTQSASQYVLAGCAHFHQQVVEFSLVMHLESWDVNGLYFSCRYLPSHLLFRIDRCVQYAQFLFSNHTSFLPCIGSTLVDQEWVVLGLEHLCHRYAWWQGATWVVSMSLVITCWVIVVDR